MTTAQRRAAYAARVNVHPVCRIRTNGAVPQVCQLCDMIAAYRDRRQAYLDAVDDADAQDLREVPIFVPTFKWWLSVWHYPTPPEHDEYADDTHLDA